MKPRKYNPLNTHVSITAAFSVALLACFSMSSAFAAIRYWDGGTTDILTNGDGASAGGDGTWNTTLLNWDAGASAHVAWNNAANDTAEINGGTQTLTLGTDVTVGRINQKAGASGATIAEGTGLRSITLGSASTILNIAASTTVARSLNVNARLTGTNNLSVQGPTTTAGGAVNLNRVNTFTGSITIAQTTLRIGNAGAAGQLNSGNYSNTISIGTNASFVYASSLDQTLSGVISGVGSLTKNSSGSSLSLTGTNTYSGATSITAGTIALTGSGSINGTSGITVNGSGAKLLQSSSVAVSPTVTLTQGTLTGNGTVNTVNVGDNTGGIVSNNNGVAGAALTIGTLTFNGSATVNTFGNASPAIATTTLATNAAGLVTINPTAASWTTGSTYDLISYGGGSIGGGGFAKFAIGTVTGKAGRQTATLIDTGTAIAVQIGGTTDFPYWVGDTNTQWDTTTGNNWKLFTAGTYTNFIPTDNVLFNDNATGAGPITVNIDAADVATTTTTFDNSTKDYLLNSSGGFGISSGSLTKSGTGTVTLATVNTYTGSTTINAGALVIDDGSIASSGNIVNDSVLQYKLNASARTYANVISGVGSLSKTGTNTLTLSGNNTFTGGLNIADGAVTLGHANAAGTGTITLAAGAAANAAAKFSGALTVVNPITVASGSTGANTVANVGTGAVTLNGAITINTGTTLTVDSSSSNNSNFDYGNGTITGGGSVVTAGTSTGNFVIRGASTYSGGTTLGGSGIFVPGSSTNGPAGSPTDGVFGTGTVTIGAISMRSTTLGDTTIGNPLTLAGDFTVVTVSSERTLTFSGPATLTGTRTITSNVGTTVASKSLTFSGNIGDGGSGYGIIKAGTGTLVLAGNNTYSGSTTVGAGSLQISGTGNLGDGSATNSITIGTATIQSTANTYDLGVNRAITLTGSGKIQADAGTLTVSGSVTNDANLFTLFGAGNINFSGVIGTGATPTGGLNIGSTTMPANVTLGGSNLFTGNVSLPANNTQPKAVLTLTNSGALGVGPKTVTSTGSNGTNGGEIHLQNNISLANDISFTVSGYTIYNDSGSNTINGNIAMTSGAGDTYLTSTSGTLTINGNMSAITTSRRLRFRGAGNGVINGIISNGSTVDLPVWKDFGTGTWTLSGANTYTGSTTIDAGTLALAATGSIATSSSVSLGAAGTLDTTAQTTYAIPAAQPVAISIDPAGTGSSGKIVAAGLDITNAVVTLNPAATLDDPVYVLATYTPGSLTGAAFAAPLPTVPAGYTLNYAYEGNKIALVQSGGGSPEIAVEQPALTDIPSGNVTPVSFNTVTLESNSSLTFTIRNSGTANLNLTGTPPNYVVVGGANQGDFSVTAQPSSSVAASDTTTFTVRFAPTAAGVRNATLSIANNDTTGGEDPFVINISGTGQTKYQAWSGGATFNTDANGDGVSNGLAFLLGAASVNENAINRLPTVTQSGGGLVLNFNCLPVSARGGASIKVEHGTNLAGWTATTAVVPNATNAVPDNNVTFVVGAGPVGPPALNSVQATIGSAAAAGGGKLFGRLKAENP